MANVLELITDALQDIGAIAIEESPTAAEANSALRALNDMIEMWNTESLMVYSVDPEVFPLVPSQFLYTLGAGGDFNIPRPVQIYKAYTRDSQGNDYSVEVTTDSEVYSSIITKNTSSSLVTVLYDDGNFPLKNIYLWPVPSDGSFSLVLWVWKPINSFSTLSDSIILPPGYKHALQKNLAIDLSSAYGKEPSQTLQHQAIESKAQLKRINNITQTLKFDPTLTRRGRVFNWLTGY